MSELEHEIRDLRHELRELQKALVRIEWTLVQQQQREDRFDLLVLEVLREILQRLPKPSYPKTHGGSITVTE